MRRAEPRRSALVTGGSSGIGRAVVERLSADGFRVAFTARNADRGLTVAANTGAAFIPADATDRCACDRSVEDALACLGGRLDALVTCVGIVFASPLESTPEAVARELLEVNLTAVFRYSRRCFSVMRQQRSGAIVHIASDAGIRGIHRLPAYSATKAGVVALSEVLAAEGAPHGVRCNAICPGATYPGVQSTPTGFAEHAEDASTWAAAPSGRHGEGSDVAAAVSWLLSDDSRHVSGATLRVDGAAAAALRGVTRA